MEDTRRADPFGLISVACGLGALLTLPLTLVPLLGCLCLPLGPLASLGGFGLGVASIFRTGPGAPYQGRTTAIAGTIVCLAYVLLLVGGYLLVGKDVGKQVQDLIQMSNDTPHPL